MEKHEEQLRTEVEAILALSRVQTKLGCALTLADEACDDMYSLESLTSQKNRVLEFRKEIADLLFEIEQAGAN